MARDDAPKDRQQAQLARKSMHRQGYDRVLIVSEGGKTEPHYFAAIRQMLRLPTATVEVRPSALGTAPIQVVEYAKKIFCEGDSHKRIQPRAFECVYAVFDRDAHDSFFEAHHAAAGLAATLRNDLKKKISFKVIASVPNFEFWLLLHFEDVRAPLHRDEAMQRLKKYLPKYAKGATDVYASTAARQDVATTRAKRLLDARHRSDDGAALPYTQVVELVDYLFSLKSPSTP